jgi:hypothetical protein
VVFVPGVTVTWPVTSTDFGDGAPCHVSDSGAPNEA